MAHSSKSADQILFLGIDGHGRVVLQDREFAAVAKTRKGPDGIEWPDLDNPNVFHLTVPAAREHYGDFEAFGMGYESNARLYHPHLRDSTIKAFEAGIDRVQGNFDRMTPAKRAAVQQNHEERAASIVLPSIEPIMTSGGRAEVQPVRRDGALQADQRNPDAVILSAGAREAAEIDRHRRLYEQGHIAKRQYQAIWDAGLRDPNLDNKPRLGQIAAQMYDLVYVEGISF